MSGWDAVRLELLWTRLISIANDQARALVRAAFSPVLREAEDLSCALFDRKGRMIVQADTGTPGHINTLALAVRHFLERYPPEDLEPGDVLVTNDPWKATGHKHDVTVVTPVFLGGALLGFTGSTGHVVDIGGNVFSADAHEVYEEGLAIPILKLYRAGEPNEDLFEILRENIRVPRAVLGDIRALVSSNAVSGEKLAAFVEEFGVEDLSELADTIFSRTARAAREAISRLPPGRYAHSVRIDGFDEPLTLQAAVVIREGELEVDFSGTSPQVARGINVPYPYTYAYTFYSVKCALFPELPNNAGAFRHVQVSAPEGCLLNALFPAPVSARHLTGYFVSSAVFGCLARVAPGRVVADSSILSDLQLDGINLRGERFSYLGFVCGGWGARPTKDGVSTISFPGNVANTPIEIAEQETPLLFLEKSLATDSGGPGRHRGGLGQRLRARLRGDHPAVLSCLYERVHNPAQGMFGGKAGAPTEIVVNGTVRPHPKSKCVLRPGDELLLVTSGAGGYDPPENRDPEAIQRDIREGLISPERARSDYGFDPGGETPPQGPSERKRP